MRALTRKPVVGCSARRALRSSGLSFYPLADTMLPHPHQVFYCALVMGDPILDVCVSMFAKSITGEFSTFKAPGYTVIGAALPEAANADAARFHDSVG